jgi:hypothetical protein
MINSANVVYYNFIFLTRYLLNIDFSTYSHIRIKLSISSNQGHGGNSGSAIEFLRITYWSNC